MECDYGIAYLLPPHFSGPRIESSGPRGNVYPHSPAFEPPTDYLRHWNSGGCPGSNILCDLFGGVSWARWILLRRSFAGICARTLFQSPRLMTGTEHPREIAALVLRRTNVDHGKDRLFVPLISRVCAYRRRDRATHCSFPVYLVVKSPHCPVTESRQSRY